VRQERLAEIINLAKNLDDPTSSPPSRSDGRLPQKAFLSQSVDRAKTPYPGYVILGMMKFPPSVVARGHWGGR
jgi:hypothetical protein